MGVLEWRAILRQRAKAPHPVKAFQMVLRDERPRLAVDGLRPLFIVWQISAQPNPPSQNSLSPATRR